VVAGENAAEIRARMRVTTTDLPHPNPPLTKGRGLGDLPPPNPLLTKEGVECSLFIGGLRKARIDARYAASARPDIAKGFTVAHFI